MKSSVLSTIRLFVALHQASLVLAQIGHDNNAANCSCYTIGGPRSGYFLNHRFFDYRNLANEAGQYTIPPPPLTSLQDAAHEETPAASRNVLDADSFTMDWQVQAWAKDISEDSPVRMKNSKQNVYISQLNETDLSDNSYKTWLTLRTVRLPAFQSAAEIESLQANFHYASIRFRARVAGAAGAAAAIFTYYDDDNESDIEVLTRDPIGTYHYTNQPSVDKDGNVIPEASRAPSSLPPRDEWHTHRIDWLPGHSQWFVDDILVANNTINVPKKPSKLVMNMWSTGGVWSGNMSVGGQAEFQIQWIQMVFNTSSPASRPSVQKIRDAHLFEERKDPECQNVCKVDGVRDVGVPEAGIAVTTGAAGALMTPRWLVIRVLVLVQIVVFG